MQKISIAIGLLLSVLLLTGSILCSQTSPDFNVISEKDGAITSPLSHLNYRLNKVECLKAFADPTRAQAGFS